MTSCLKKFKAPRKVVDVKPKEDPIEIEEDSSVSTTEEFSMEEDNMLEAVFRDECKEWLALNGKALFALEVSRFLAKERKSHDVKPKLAKSGRHVSPISLRDAE